MHQCVKIFKSSSKELSRYVKVVVEDNRNASKGRYIDLLPSEYRIFPFITWLRDSLRELVPIEGFIVSRLYLQR